MSLREGKDWNMNRWMSVLVSWLAAAGIEAAPLAASRVPEDARWVAHIDVDLLKNTAVGAHVLSKLGEPEAARKLEAVQAMFRFDPRKDLKSLTLFGPDKDDLKSVMTLEGNFDAGHLASIIRGGDGYAEHPYEGDVIHEWLQADKGKTNIVFGTLLSSGQIVMGKRRDRVESAIDTLRGRKPGLTPSGAVGGLLPASQGAVLVAAVDVERIPGAGPRSRMLQQTERGSIVMGEQGGEVTASVKMDAGDAAKAGQLQQVVQGVIALGILGEDKNPEFARLCRTARCVLEGSVVSLSLGCSPADFIKMTEQKKAGTEASNPS
jgi:hypothetical protein